MKRARGALALAALVVAAGACSSILGLDGVEFDGDDGTLPGEHCQNQVVDGDESAVDCGGSCPGCAPEQPCNVDGDCKGGDCEGGTCAPSCSDGVENGGESGVDCGGDCPPCDDEEDCAEPGDEDGNDLADCLDPVCWNSQCIEMPNGWLGPVTLVDPSEPSCPEGWGVPFGDAYTELSAEDATCSPCQCGPQQNGACGDVFLELYADNNCNADIDVVPATSFCEELQANGVDSIRVPEVPYAGGACPPSGGQITAPEPEWAGAVRVCMGTPIGRCAAGPCTPPPPPGAPVCILQIGDVQCPEPWSDRRPLYQRGAFVDTRSCSACACDVPPSGLCNALISLYQTPTCGFTVDQVMSTGACYTAAAFNIEAFRVIGLDPPASTMCTPLGGQAEGGVVPGEAGGTACCLPPELVP